MNELKPYAKWTDEEKQIAIAGVVTAGGVLLSMLVSVEKAGPTAILAISNGKEATGLERQRDLRVLSEGMRDMLTSLREAALGYMQGLGVVPHDVKTIPEEFCSPELFLDFVAKGKQRAIAAAKERADQLRAEIEDAVQTHAKNTIN